MKKRYIILALAAIELASLPAGIKLASSLDFKPSVDNEMKQSLIFVDISKYQPGLSTFLVSSDAPFAIAIKETMDQAENLREYKVEVVQSGNINGFNFGEHAALPGPSLACTLARSGDPAIIYQASGQTAPLKARLLDRSVAVNIHYPKGQKPLFEFLTASEMETLSPAPACESQPS